MSLAAAWVLALLGASATAQTSSAADAESTRVSTRWTTEDGLPQNSVVAIQQTRDGYLWLGTFGGLARFDGQRFTTFDLATTPNLGTNRILSLFEDSRGALWIGTQGGGATRYEDGSFELFAPGSRAPRGEVWAITEDNGGAIWLGGGSIVRFANGQCTEWPSLPGAPTARVSDLHVDREGVLWSATDQGIGRFTGTEFERVDHVIAGTFGRNAGGPLWVTRGTSFAVLHEGTFETLGTPDLRPQPRQSVARGRNGVTWLARSDGVFAMREQPAPGRLPRLEPLGGAASGSGMRSVHEDREGNLWVGTNGQGLLRMRSVPFSKLTTPEREPVTEVIQGPSGEILFASGEGATLRYDGEALVKVAPELQAALFGRSSRLLDSEGNLWSTSFGGTLSYWDGERSIEVHHSPEQPLTALHQAANGDLWVGGVGQVLRRRDGEVRAVELSGAGIVNQIRNGPNGSVWLVADGPMLAQIQNGVLTKWTADDGMPRGRPRGVHIDAEGVAWVATYGSGLVRIDGNRCDVLTRDHGLPDDSLGGILEDDEGRLWINSNRGVFFASRTDLEAAALGREAQAPCFLQPTGEGNSGSACRDSSGRMWFPTIHGVALIDPSRARSNPQPPGVAIERVRIDDVEYDPRQPIVVPPGSSNLEIEYTALTFIDSEQARFRYRLEGHDDGWVEAGTRRSAMYTRVTPGSYRFQVIAANASQQWNTDGAWVELELEPYFHQTRLFVPSVALGIALLLLAGHRARTNSLKRHNEDLEREIRERERAEAETRALEMRLREAQKLEAVGRLAGGVAHDFNNILTVVLGRAELLAAEADAPKDVDSHANEIVACARRAAALTRQLLAFSRQQVLRPRVVDPTDVLAELEPMLSRLIPENIALNIETQSSVGLVEVDPHQLGQVVMNLVVNARDAMPNGGQLDVEVALVLVDDEARSTLESVTADEFVEIRVRDTGVGIPASELPNVFEPFFTTKPVGSGTGLGLASVHGIVRQSGGFVAVESEPGRGTTFRVRLPRSTRDQSPTGVRTAAPDNFAAGTETILVCDDDAAVLKVTQAVLKQHGYDVLAANHPTDALRIAREHGDRIRLLITDVVMPDMGGKELHATLAASLDELRVIYFSGYSPSEANIDPNGPSPVLQKPVDLRDLLRVVRETLDGGERSPREPSSRVSPERRHH